MDVACSAGGRCLCLAPWSLKEEIEEAEAASRCAEFAQKRKTSAVNTSNVHSHA